MAKTKKEKEKIIKNLIEKINKSKSIVFSDYTGLTVNELTDLRSKLRKEKVDYQVVKNTLLRYAIKESDKDFLAKEDFFATPGPKAISFCYDDEIAGARDIYNFSKKHKALKLLAGVLGEKFLNKEEIIALAKLPSRDELLGKTVATMKAPISNFVNILAGNLRSLINVLLAISKEKA